MLPLHHRSPIQHSGECSLVSQTNCSAMFLAAGRTDAIFHVLLCLGSPLILNFFIFFPPTGCLRFIVSSKPLAKQEERGRQSFKYFEFAEQIEQRWLANSYLGFGKIKRGIEVCFLIFSSERNCREISTGDETSRTEEYSAQMLDQHIFASGRESVTSNTIE